MSFSILLLILSLSNCKVNEENGNPVPVLTKISPAFKVTNMPSFVLTANGSGFIKDSKIVFNNIELAINFIDSSEINAIINSSQIKKNNGTVLKLEAKTLSVFIKNPEPVGGDSDNLEFTIADNHTFTVPNEISGTNSSYNNPVIAVGNNGEVYIVFENYNDNSKIYSISFIKSTDHGTNWSSPENLVEFDQKCYNPAIAIGPDGDIYVTFYAIKLYFLSLKNREIQWSTPLELTDNTNIALQSAICVDKNNIVNIIWPQTENNYNYKVFYTGGSGDSINFPTPINIFANWENYTTTYHPAISADGDGNIYATWTAWPSGGSRYSNTQFNYSNDEGLNWELTDRTFNVCSSSDLAVDPSGNLSLVISNSYLPFQNQILFYRSTDKGLTFNSNIKITEGSSDYGPKISIDSMSNNNVIFNRSGKYYYCRSIDNGQQWTTPFFISEIGEDADLTIDNEGNIYIVYVSGGDKLHFIRNNN